MLKYELIVIWDTGEKEFYLYDTRDKAEKVGNNFKWIFGNQIAWTGTREKFISNKKH